MINRAIPRSLLPFVLLAVPGGLLAQTGIGPAPHGPDSEPSAPGAWPTGFPVHITSKGAFIDPLITEHAFVDRKVRTDFNVRLLKEDEAGELFVQELIFEYAFTDWFSLELAQPFIFTSPEVGDAAEGLDDINLGAKFQLTKADETGGFIVSTGVESSLPSGEGDIGAGEEYVVAPLLLLDWAVGSGLFKVQTQGELEIKLPRSSGDAEVEALEWNTAVSFFAWDNVVPLLEVNTAFEELEQDTRNIYAVTPGVVVSLKDRAGTSFDVATGVQFFFGSEREEDVALLVSFRHHWPVSEHLHGREEASSR